VIYVKISGACYDEYKRKGTSMSKMSGNDFVSKGVLFISLFSNIFKSP